MSCFIYVRCHECGCVWYSRFFAACPFCEPESVADE